MRGTEPHTLSQLLRGELDWIVMKALEKDRTRRYATALGLASDVERYLSDEPVEACPPSAGYRLRKFVRRNFAAIASGGLVAGALLVGTTVSVWQAVEATRARHWADEHAQAATAASRLANERLTSETSARGDAQRAQRLAEESFKDSLDAVDRMLTRVANDKLIHHPGLDAVRKDLLLDALTFYEKFLEHRRDDPQLRLEVARAWSRVGFVQENLGDRAACHAALHNAVSIAEVLHQENAADPEPMGLMVDAYLILGYDYWLTRNLPEAEEALNQGLVVCRQLQQLFPDGVEHRLKEVRLQLTLAMVYNQTHREPQGNQLVREVVPAQRDLLTHHPERLADRHGLVNNLCHLAQVLRDNSDESEKVWDEAESLAESLVAARFPYASLALGRVLYQRAESRSDLAQQEQLIRRAGGLLDSFVAANPDLVLARNSWAHQRQMLIRILIRQGRDEEAESVFRQLLETARSHNPLEWLFELRRSQDALCSFLVGQGRIADSNTIRQEIFDILQRFGDGGASSARLANNVAGFGESFSNYARQLVQVGRGRDAEQAFRQSIQLHHQAMEIYRKLVDQFPRNGEFPHSLTTRARDCAKAYAQLGELLSRRGEAAEAADAYNAALVPLATAVETDPERAVQINLLDSSSMIWLSPSELAACAGPSFRTAILDLANKAIERTNGSCHAYLTRAELHVAMRNFDAARTDFRVALTAPAGPYYDTKLPSRVLNAIAWEIVTSAPSDDSASSLAAEFALAAVANAPDAANLWSTLGVAQYRTRNWAAALQALQKSVELRAGGHIEDRFFLAMTHWQLGDTEEANRWYDKAVDGMERNPPESPELVRFRAEATAMLGRKELIEGTEKK